MMSLKYDDIEPSDEDEVDEVSEYDSTFESFQSSSCPSMSEYRWPPCLEIEEIDQGWTLFSRSSSSKASISSLSVNQAYTDPQPWRLNWVKNLFGPSAIVGKPNSIAPVVDQLKPSNIFDDTLETVTVGEWGALKNGFDERPFDHRGYDGIKRIFICCGRLVDSIRIQYTKQGKLEWTEKVGGNGGRRCEIVLDDPDEYITKVTGYYDISRGISSLTFITNQKTHGPFGLNRGRLEGKMMNTHIPFEYAGGKLVGFKGTARRYLSSVGFNICYLPYSCENYGSKCIASTASAIQHAPNINQVPCRFHQISVERFGYPHHIVKQFNHGEYDGIKRIFISHGRCINFFMVEYMENGQPQLSQAVGKMGESSNEVVLDYPHEFLQSVTGNYFSRAYDRGVTSLTFHSNTRKYGPFGYEEGQPLEVSGGKIVGFQGSASRDHLFTIGFHMVPKAALSV